MCDIHVEGSGYDGEKVTGAGVLGVKMFLKFKSSYFLNKSTNGVQP